VLYKETMSQVLRKSALLFVPLLFSLPFWSLEYARAQTTHGTLITVLANKEGIVVVSDSMASSSGGLIQYRAPVQKILRYDDQMVCATAGLLVSAPTSNLRLAPQIPTVILGIVEAYRDSFARKGIKKPMSETLEGLSSALRYEFQFYADLESRLGHQDIDVLKTYGLELRLAGFDTDGLPKVGILDLRLEPASDSEHGHWNAKEVKRELRLVLGPLLIVPAGIRAVEDEILANPRRSADVPIIHEYINAMRKDQGETFSIPEMKKLGQLFKDRTANDYRQVGNRDQIAIITKDGGVQITGPSFPEISKPAEFLAMRCEPKGVITGRGQIGGGGNLIIEGCTFQGATVVLDDSIFLHCKFSNSTLLYGGGPVFLDETTEVQADSRLEMSHEALLLHIPFIEGLRSRICFGGGGTLSCPDANKP
jgi:hypothetical protein